MSPLPPSNTPAEGLIDQLDLSACAAAIADGSLTSAANMMGQEQTEAGTYSVATNEGNTLSVSTTVTKEGSEPEVETVTVTFASADSITISDEGGEAIPFNRKAE